MRGTKKPNILLITSDQQHWNTLSCLGSEAQTPALDKLASEGTLFERAYCPNPTCTPTRASIITGKYPSQHGAYSLGTKLPENQVTLGELPLRKEHLVYVGHRHLGFRRGGQRARLRRIQLARALLR